MFTVSFRSVAYKDKQNYSIQMDIHTVQHVYEDQGPFFLPVHGVKCSFALAEWYFDVLPSAAVEGKVLLGECHSQSQYNGHMLCDIYLILI